MRYYLNNFKDGRKQDALDFATGAFVISKGSLMRMIWQAVQQISETELCLLLQTNLRPSSSKPLRACCC